MTATETAETTAAAPAARVPWSAVGLIALVAVVVRLPSYFSGRSIVFDDGQYGVSIVDMRHGLAPYTGVFSSQGPLHYPILYLGDLLGFHTLDAPRITPVLAGVAAALGVWAIARRLGVTPGVALVAGLLLATSGSMIWATGQVTADGPAVAIMVWAVWAALAYRDAPSTTRAVAVGLLVAAALAVKPLVGTALVPVAWWMYDGRRRHGRGVGDLFVAAGTAVAAWFVVALPWGLGRVWEQSITYHTGKGPSYSKLFQLGKLTSLVPLRDGIVVVAVALGIVATIVGATRTRSRHADVVVVVVWLAFAAFVLVFEKAMFANHLVNVVVPLVVLFAVRPPPLRWLAIALVVAVPWAVVNVTAMIGPLSYSGIEAQLERDLRSLPPGARAISDDPAYVWRAGLSTPAMMNDVSRMRIDQGDLTTAKVVAAAAEPETCAVVIWSFRFGSLLPGLHEGLQAAGYTRAREYAPFRELWLKPSCRGGPTNAAAGRAGSPR